MKIRQQLLGVLCCLGALVLVGVAWLTVNFIAVSSLYKRVKISAAVGAENIEFRSVQVSRSASLREVCEQLSGYVTIASGGIGVSLQVGGPTKDIELRPVEHNNFMSFANDDLNIALLPISSLASDDLNIGSLLASDKLGIPPSYLEELETLRSGLVIDPLLAFLPERSQANLSGGYLDRMRLETTRLSLVSYLLSDVDYVRFATSNDAAIVCQIKEKEGETVASIFAFDLVGSAEWYAKISFRASRPIGHREPPVVAFWKLDSDVGAAGSCP